MAWCEFLLRQYEFDNDINEHVLRTDKLCFTQNLASYKIPLRIQGSVRTQCVIINTLDWYTRKCISTNIYFNTTANCSRLWGFSATRTNRFPRRCTPSQSMWSLDTTWWCTDTNPHSYTKMVGYGIPKKMN